MLVGRQSINIQSLRTARESRESKQAKQQRKLSSAEIIKHENGAVISYSAKFKYGNDSVTQSKPVPAEQFVKRFKNYYEYYSSQSKILFDALEANSPALRPEASAPVPVPANLYNRLPGMSLSANSVTIFGARSTSAIAAQAAAERTAAQRSQPNEANGAGRFVYGRTCG